MQFYNLFIDSNLPAPLPKEELYDYFDKMKHGDKKAREKIIHHNIRLVLDEVIKNFSNTPYELRELVSIGLISLVRSVDTFDMAKGYQFSSYAAKCINNEIYNFIRKEKNYKNEIGFEQPIGIGKNGTELRMKDTLIDIDSDFVIKYEENELYEIIRKVVNELPERDKYIIIKHFGLQGNEPLKQAEIASELGVTPQYVSSQIKKIMIKIKVQLQKKEVTGSSPVVNKKAM